MQEHAVNPIWGTHAPSRAGFGASPKHSSRQKFAIAGARSPAREARALPRLCAFTLIELLVVITIIVILLGFLFPAFQGVQDRARKVQAKNDLTQIATAVNAYYTEYGKYPIVTDDSRIANTSDLFYTLRAVASGANASNAANTRQIAFLNIPDAKGPTKPKNGIGGEGQYYDPWGQTYK